jgi:hypothetical protein
LNGFRPAVTVGDATIQILSGWPLHFATGIVVHHFDDSEKGVAHLTSDCSFCDADEKRTKGDETNGPTFF